MDQGRRPTLTLWDTISLLVGIVVGTAIFKSPGMVFRSVEAVWEAIGLWVAGGALSLAGALCYAELAAAYPRSGGDYEYLGRAYGRGMGLQFAWAQLLIVLTGSVGSMAYAFADYARDFWQLSDDYSLWLVLGSIVVLTATNLIGLRAGATAQNILTTAKLAGLAAIAVAAFTGSHRSDLLQTSPGGGRDIGLALVFVLYAYSGWTHAAYVAAQVREPQRRLPQALLAGVGVVTLIYLVINLSFVVALGSAGAASSETPASDAVRVTAGDGAARLVSLLVMLSALGAINGTVLTGAHVLSELAIDYPGLAWLQARGGRKGTPVRALLLQSFVAILLVLAVGTAPGRGSVDAILQGVGLQAAPWDKYYGGFETLVAASAPLFWGFLLLTGTTIFILRWKDPHRERPFRTPGYPVTPLVFCAACGYMLYASVIYARGLTLIALLPIASAFAISWWHRPRATVGND